MGAVLEGEGLLPIGEKKKFRFMIYDYNNAIYIIKEIGSLTPSRVLRSYNLSTCELLIVDHEEYSCILSQEAKISLLRSLESE